MNIPEEFINDMAIWIAMTVHDIEEAEDKRI